MSSLSFFILSAALLTVQNSLNGPLSRHVNVDENGFLTERISFVASSFQGLFALAPANFGWAVTSKLQLLCSKIWAFIHSDKYTQVALGPPHIKDYTFGSKSIFRFRHKHAIFGILERQCCPSRHEKMVQGPNLAA